MTDMPPEGPQTWAEYQAAYAVYDAAADDVPKAVLLARIQERLCEMRSAATTPEAQPNRGGDGPW